MPGSVRRAWQRFAALPNEAPAKTLLIMFVVASACAALVSFTAVTLRPLQEQHRAAERESRMVAMLELLPGLDKQIGESGADAVETRVIDLASGAPVAAEAAASFDWRAAIADPAQCQPITQTEDVAGIGCRPGLARVHLVRRRDELAFLVLPIYGKGYQSTLHALLVLEGGLDTIAALQVQEQGDTPGIGSRITDVAWLEGFSGRRLRDDSGVLRFDVRREVEDPRFEVDAIAGATRSSTALGRAVRFWLGSQGYGPLLDRLAGEAER